MTVKAFFETLLESIGFVTLKRYEDLSVELNTALAEQADLARRCTRLEQSNECLEDELGSALADQDLLSQRCLLLETENTRLKNLKPVFTRPDAFGAVRLSLSVYVHPHELRVSDVDTVCSYYAGLVDYELRKKLTDVARPTLVDPRTGKPSNPDWEGR